MIICGYCYFENNDESHAAYCPFKKDGAWNLGTFAPNSAPLKIDENVWVRTQTGRYRVKENKEYESS